MNTQLPGAKFSGCKFDYATFEKTLIDARVLDTEWLGLETLKMRFVRSLRINFQQLGDADAVNKAMRVELTTTEIHLKMAWQSNESYYIGAQRAILHRRATRNTARNQQQAVEWRAVVRAVEQDH